jgi:hypothetical protein
MISIIWLIAQRNNNLRDRPYLWKARRRSLRDSVLS